MHSNFIIYVNLLICVDSKNFLFFSMILWYLKNKHAE